jgi:hypothetical protein
MDHYTEIGKISAHKKEGFVNWSEVSYDIKNFIDLPEESEIQGFMIECKPGEIAQLMLVFNYNGKEYRGSIPMTDIEIAFKYEHKDSVKARYEKIVEDNGGTYPKGLIGGYKMWFVYEVNEEFKWLGSSPDIQS